MESELSLYLKISIVFLVAFFIATACLYVFFADEEHGSASETIIAKVVDTLADELNPLRTSTPLNEFVKVYELRLSLNDLNYFNEAGRVATELGYRNEFASEWRGVDLIYEGKKYDVKMSLHGDLPNHYMNAKKSFKIKTSKKEYINNVRRFNFIIAEDRQFFGTLFAEEAAKRIGLVSSHYELAVVFFNGVGFGLYVVEEKWDGVLLEKNGLPNATVLTLNDNWIHQEIESHITPFDLEASSYTEIDSPNAEEIKARLEQMLNVVKTDNQKLFSLYFDVEQVARFEAWRTILGQVHDFEGDNLRLYYDNTSGKFNLIARNEGGIGLLTSCSIEAISIIGFVSRNPEVIKRKGEILSQVNEESLIDFYDGLVKKYNQVALLDNTTIMRSSKVGYYIRRNRKNLINNLKFKEVCK